MSCVNSHSVIFQYVCLFGLIGNNLFYHFLVAISVRGMMGEQTMVPESPSTKVERRLPAGNIWELLFCQKSQVFDSRLMISVSTHWFSFSRSVEPGSSSVSFGHQAQVRNQFQDFFPILSNRTFFILTVKFVSRLVWLISVRVRSLVFVCFAHRQMFCL